MGQKVASACEEYEDNDGVDYWVNVSESRGTSSPGLSWIQGLRVVVPAHPGCRGYRA